MSFLRLSAVFFAVHLIQCSTAQVSVEFPTLVHRVQEDQRVISVQLTKNGLNNEEIVVLVTPVTLDEYYDSRGPQLPPEFDGFEIPDPAEYDVSGKQDFIRNGPIKYVFGPSSGSETGTIEVRFNDDSINEADEGFLLVIEISPATEPVAVKGDGVSMVIIVDEDPVLLAFEEPQYEVQERAGIIDDLVYITKNGMKSEQILRVLIHNPSGSAVRGDDYVLDESTEVNFPPELDRLAFPVQLVDDQLPEETESFQLVMSVEDDTEQPRVTIGFDTTTVNIEDNDMVTVGFEKQSYTVTEDEGAVEVCAVISDPEDIDLFVIATLSTRDGTAKSGADYSELKEFVSLPTFDDGKKVCYKILISFDEEIEHTEKFSVQLEPEVSTPQNVRFEPDHVPVYLLDDDKVNECLLGTHNCHANAVCQDTLHSFMCTCRNGYTGDGVECNDVNECFDSSSNYCDDLATCTNTDGSYTCTCPNGFNGNGKTCTPNAPIHDCLQDGDCGRNAKCRGKPQGNKCVCRDGYHGNGRQCQEINECTSGSHRCPQQSRCVNTNGSYFCKCNSGYRPSGRYQCVDHNECRTYHHNCDKNATCRNTIGSFTCTCKPGYTGNGIRGSCRAASG